MFSFPPTPRGGSVSLPTTPSAELDPHHLATYPANLVNSDSPNYMNVLLSRSKEEEKRRKLKRKERRGLNDDRWKFSALCEANSINVENCFDNISDYVNCTHGDGGGGGGKNTFRVSRAEDNIFDKFFFLSAMKKNWDDFSIFANFPLWTLLWHSL